MSSNSYDWYYIFALACVIIGVVVVIIIRWYYRKSAELLQRWAQKNGYHILEQDHRSFARGPFFWTANDSQAVFRVRVQDPAGFQRRRWVRVGSWWTGLFSDKVDVRWDDESS